MDMGVQSKDVSNQSLSIQYEGNIGGIEESTCAMGTPKAEAGEAGELLLGNRRGGRARQPTILSFPRLTTHHPSLSIIYHILIHIDHDRQS